MPDIINFKTMTRAALDTFIDTHFAYREDSDRFDNEVSILTLPENGATVRMVHHTPRNADAQRATIFKGRGVFVRMVSFDCADDCMSSWIKVGGYEASWGDGDLLSAINNPAGPDIIPQIEHVGESFPAFTLLAVSAVVSANLWQTKDVPPRAK